MPNYVRNRIVLTGEETAIADMLNAIKDPKHTSVIDFNKIIPMPKELDVESGSIVDIAINVYLSAVNPANRNFDHEKLTNDEFQKRLKVAREIVNNTIELHYKSDGLKNLPGLKLYLADRMTVDDLVNTGKQYIDNMIQYGHATWYEWCTANWDTKWNALNSEITKSSNKPKITALHGDPEAILLLCGTKNATQILFDTAWSEPAKVIAKLASMYPNIRFVHGYANEDVGAGTGVDVYENGKCLQSIHPQLCSATAIELYAAVNSFSLRNDCHMIWDNTTKEYVYMY